MENRELTMDDYLAMFRRRAKLILIPALLAPLAGFGVSYFFPAKYLSLIHISSQSILPDKSLKTLSKFVFGFTRAGPTEWHEMCIRDRSQERVLAGAGRGR